MSELLSAKIFAVKTTGGQERTVARLLETRIALNKLKVYSMLALDSQRAYIFVEAPNAHVVDQAITGVQHARGRVPGMVRLSEIEKFLVTKSIVSELSAGDTIEIIAGPFKGMRAKINRVEPARQEVTVTLLEAISQFPVTIDAGFLKLVEKAKGAQ